MEFKTDIFALNKPTKVKFNLIGAKLPNNKDVFFRAKQQELLDQYCAARIFINETETDDWRHWFDPTEEPSNTAFKLIFKSHFYEAALFYYNAVVDLSWTLCYVAAEFACNQKGDRVNINEMKTIEDAAKLLRSAENNVTSPTAETNPFGYLKSMSPEFEPIIDDIIVFWNSFSPSDVRKIYNYCKHKGRPAYIEIEQLRPGRLMGYYCENRKTGEKIQMPSDVRDVQYSFSLEAAIEELRVFDDETLFPYIQNLIKSIEDVLSPSPMV